MVIKLINNLIFGIVKIFKQELFNNKYYFRILNYY